MTSPYCASSRVSHEASNGVLGPAELQEVVRTNDNEGVEPLLVFCFSSAEVMVAQSDTTVRILLAEGRLFGLYLSAFVPGA